MDLRLLRHLRERLVVEHAVDLGHRRSALRGQIGPCPGERIEVRRHRQGTIDDRGRRIVRAPEVIDIGRVQARDRFDLQQLRIRRDEHRHGAGALSGLTGGVELIAGDIRSDDEHALFGRTRDDADGGLQGGGRRIAGLFDLDDAHLRRQVEQRVHRHARGLRLVRARLRGEQHRPDALGAAALDDARDGRGGHGDDVLIGSREAELVLAEAEAELGRIGFVRPGEVVESDDMMGRGQFDVVDADRCSARSSV